ncbi:MAG: hypothetical protein A3I63_01970 [Betaproteobacteria bacterium RIFCSPLOWO2_02_FULL_66_14]|nr:MAG: hypothetical protein A3I63_01970 [Betaproteobacteria bacterium RIFCSPLOWO2_02_FULL_66_14]
MTERTYGIRMTADASGVVGATKATTAGLEALTKRAQELGVNVRKLEADVGKVTSTQTAYNTILQKTLEAEIKYAQGLGQQAKQTKEASAETENFVKALKEKADTLGKTRAQTEAYRAAQLSLTDAQKASVATSVKQIEAYDEHEKALGRLKTVGLAAAAVLVAYATHTAFVVKGIIDEAEQLQKLSQSLGVSTEGLSAYRYQMNLAGVSSQEFGTAMRALVRNVSEAQSGVGDGAQLFKLLGKEAEDAAKRGAPLEALLPLMADAFSRFADGPNKAALAIAFFGRTGEAMIPVLNQGAAGFNAAAKEAAEFKRIVGPDFARQSSEFNDNMRRMNALLDVQKQLLARELLPSLNQYLNVLIEIAKQKGGGIAIGILGAGAAGGGTREQQIARLESQRARLMAPDADPDMKKIDLPIIERALAAVRAQQSPWEKEYAAQQQRYAQIQAPPVPGAGSKRESDYDRIIEKIREHTAVAQLDLDTDAKLTQGQRDAMTVMVLLRDGKLKLTDTQKVAIAQAFEEQIAIEKLMASQSEAAKSAEHWARMETQAQEARQHALAGLEDKNTRQREEIEQIGLTAEQLANLKIRRAEEAVAIARQNAEMANVPEAGRGELEYYRERIRLAEEHLRITREGAVISAEANRLKKEAEQFKRDSDTIERSLTDALMRGFEGGKDAGRNFWDAMKNMARTIVLRPLIQPMVEPLGQLGAGLAKEFGGVLGGLVRGMFGPSEASMADWYPVGHTGGVIGVDALPGRMMPALAFAGARRMHDGGISGDEERVITRKGEGVFTPAQMRRLAPVESVAPTVNYNPTVNIDARGADSGVEQRLRESFGAMLYQHRRQIAGLVDEAGKARGRRVIG